MFAFRAAVIGIVSVTLNASLIRAAAVGQEAEEARQLTALKSYQARYPAADTDGDGRLTRAERDAHRVGLVLSNFPAGSTNVTVMMPMRDGARLATEVFLPPGPGPWPAVLVRSGYDRWSAALAEAAALKGETLALVTQDLRGDGDSEGREGRDYFTFDADINDGYDTVEWVASQPWCNGRVGMRGNSGHGFAAYMAMLANPPHLVAVSTINSGGSAHLYWTFHNGVRRQMYNWLSNFGAPLAYWPRPTLQPFDRAAYAARVRQSAASNTCVFLAASGWYDIFGEAPLDYFEAYGPSAKAFVRMGPSGHGLMQGRRFSNARASPSVSMPGFLEVLKGTCTNMPAQSVLVYFLMGASNSPGNVFKTAHTWPVPHTPTPYYLHAAGGLATNPPVEPAAALSYVHCPTNPVPSLGGTRMGSPGPADQRPLAGRADMLRFVSAPLEAPLEITGKVWAELEVGSDAPDTAFMAHLVDVYPDGYEALVRDGAMLARYVNGFDAPTPLEPGAVYTLRMDLWSTAYVFDAGHRIAVRVMSSDSPKYEVHPNTYEPVPSFAQASAARNTIHCSAGHPSRIVLPVVSGGTDGP